MAKMKKSVKEEYEEHINKLEIALQEEREKKQAVIELLQQAAPLAWAANEGRENLLSAYDWEREAKKILEGVKIGNYIQK